MLWDYSRVTCEAVSTARTVRWSCTTSLQARGFQPSATPHKPAREQLGRTIYPNMKSISQFLLGNSPSSLREANSTREVTSRA
jgi:hypothetical protein